MMNIVTLIGRLTADVSLRYTPGGNAVSNFSLAVDRQYSKDDEADFFDVECWRKLAELCAEHIGKGRLVAVSGRLKQERWEKDGSKRSRVKVVADTVRFLDWPKDEGRGSGDDYPEGDAPF